MRVEDVCPLTEGVESIPCHLTFKSKQWWFATYLMVIFPRKTQVEESKSSATTAHQSNRHYPAEKSSLVLMAIPAFVNPKATSKPFSSGVCGTVETWWGFNPCVWRKWQTPISMAGRLGTTVKNYWEVSVQPVLQPRWQLGRRQRIEEQAVLWQQKINHLNWDKETKVWNI